MNLCVCVHSVTHILRELSHTAHLLDGFPCQGQMLVPMRKFLNFRVRLELGLG